MLSTEDTLKLNVLITTSIAIRIDTYKLVVVGLNAQFKEQVIDLNPTDDVVAVSNATSLDKDLLKLAW